jgi:hypothetical protein
MRESPFDSTCPACLRWLPVLALAALGAGPAAQAIEEPAYTVVQRDAAFEVRQYAPRVVAEVVVAGSADDAGNQGFRLLAGYIFGKNQGERKLPMTAPVTLAAGPVHASAAAPGAGPALASDAVRLPMTAPVNQAAVPGGYLVQFMMPQGQTLATLPEPTDPRVQLRVLPAERYAVIRYSGSWSQSGFDAHLATLRQALAGAGLHSEGEPVFARYNSPFALPFFRRNEIWLKLPTAP